MIFSSLITRYERWYAMYFSCINEVSFSLILPRTALQSVLYDDQTPEEVAEHFKKQGNEAMKFQASKCLGETRFMPMYCFIISVNIPKSFWNLLKSSWGPFVYFPLCLSAVSKADGSLPTDCHFDKSFCTPRIALMNALTFYTRGLEMACKEMVCWHVCKCCMKSYNQSDQTCIFSMVLVLFLPCQGAKTAPCRTRNWTLCCIRIVPQWDWRWASISRQMSCWNCWNPWNNKQTNDTKIKIYRHFSKSRKFHRHRHPLIVASMLRLQYSLRWWMIADMQCLGCLECRDADVSNENSRIIDNSYWKSKSTKCI